VATAAATTTLVTAPALAVATSSTTLATAAATTTTLVTAPALAVTTPPAANGSAPTPAAGR
jgi:hypothetical protein